MGDIHSRGMAGRWGGWGQSQAKPPHPPDSDITAHRPNTQHTALTWPGNVLHYVNFLGKLTVWAAINGAWGWRLSKWERFRAAVHKCISSVVQCILGQSFSAVVWKRMVMAERGGWVGNKFQTTRALRERGSWDQAVEKLGVCNLPVWFDNINCVWCADYIWEFCTKLIGFIFCNPSIN